MKKIDPNIRGHVGGIIEKNIISLASSLSQVNLVLAIKDRTISWGDYLTNVNYEELVLGDWQSYCNLGFPLSVSSFYRVIQELEERGIIGIVTDGKNKKVYLNVKDMVFRSLQSMIQSGRYRLDYYDEINKVYLAVCSDFLEMKLYPNSLGQEDKVKISDLKDKVPEKTQQRRDKQATKVVASYTPDTLLDELTVCCEEYQIAVPPSFSENEEDRIKERAGFKAIIRMVSAQDMPRFIREVVSHWVEIVTMLDVKKDYSFPLDMIDLLSFGFYRKEIYEYYKTGFAEDYSEAIPERYLKEEEFDEFSDNYDDIPVGQGKAVYGF